MIVKTIRWKSRNFKKILSYILDKNWNEKTSSFAIFNNIKNSSNVLKEFKENDKYRKRRKNGVVLYHEVLSFHKEDSHNLTLLKLNEIASKYISIRSPNALCVASPHFDTENIHIHFCFSGTEYKSSKTLRMNNFNFKKVRREIENFQKEKFPELQNSVVFSRNQEILNSRNQEFKNSRILERSEKGFQMKKRLEKTNKKSDKEILKINLNSIFIKSDNFIDFQQKIVTKGFQIYSYRNKPSGILFNGRKYRFKSFGFDKLNFEKITKRKQQLKKITFERKKGVGFKREFF